MEQVIKTSKETTKMPEEVPVEEESEDDDFIGPPVPTNLGK